MEGVRQTYHLKVDASGRIVLPAEERQRNQIAEGDIVIVVADGNGLHVKTREQIGGRGASVFCEFCASGRAAFRRGSSGSSR